MSIITWVENGRKQFAVCDPKYFDRRELDFPVYESRHSSFQNIMAFSEEEVVMVSGDRKRYRRLRPMTMVSSGPGKQPGRKSA